MLAARAGNGKLGNALLRTGDARDAILHVAEEIRADLIVMSTHARRGVARTLLGSVAEMVVRRSARRRQADVKRILVAVVAREARCADRSRSR
jgi:hypothetical protein